MIAIRSDSAKAAADFYITAGRGQVIRYFLFFTSISTSVSHFWVFPSITRIKNIAIIRIIKSHLSSISRSTQSTVHNFLLCLFLCSDWDAHHRDRRPLKLAYITLTLLIIREGLGLLSSFCSYSSRFVRVPSLAVWRFIHTRCAIVHLWTHSQSMATKYNGINAVRTCALWDVCTACTTFFQCSANATHSKANKSKITHYKPNTLQKNAMQHARLGVNELSVTMLSSARC